MSVLINLRNRPVRGVFLLACDRLTGRPKSVSNVWSRTILQNSSVHHRGAAEVCSDPLLNALSQVGRLKPQPPPHHVYATSPEAARLPPDLATSSTARSTVG
jgi:hypothetical protein